MNLFLTSISGLLIYNTPATASGPCGSEMLIWTDTSTEQTCVAQHIQHDGGYEGLMVVVNDPLISSQALYTCTKDGWKLTEAFCGTNE